MRLRTPAAAATIALVAGLVAASPATAAVPPSIYKGSSMKLLNLGTSNIQVRLRLNVCAAPGRLVANLREQQIQGGRVTATQFRRYTGTHRQGCAFQSITYKLARTFYGGTYKVRVKLTDSTGLSDTRTFTYVGE